MNPEPLLEVTAADNLDIGFALEASRYPVVYSRRDGPEGMRCLSFEESSGELLIRLGDHRKDEGPGLPIDKVRAMQVARGLMEWAARQ